MKPYLGPIFFLTFALLLPLSAGAMTADELQAQIQDLLNQVSQLQQQLTNLTSDAGGIISHSAPSEFCPNLTRTLYRGSRGSDVILLQQSLVVQNLLNANSDTGYFGPLTEVAVQRWQASHGIVSSADAASTGYGVVGVSTRAVIAQNCYISNTTPILRPIEISNPLSCPTYNIPPCPNGTLTSLGHGSTDCNLGYQCTVKAAANQNFPSQALQEKAAEAAQIIALAEQEGYVRIVVEGASPVSTELTSEPTFLQDLKAHNHSIQDAIVMTHFGDPSNLRIEGRFQRGFVRFDYTPTFSINVNRAELEALAADPRVVRIYQTFEVQSN
jgi:peptidoglycan hydrolase-like protein with peptidoglycan-binding domain